MVTHEPSRAHVERPRAGAYDAPTVAPIRKCILHLRSSKGGPRHGRYQRIHRVNGESVRHATTTLRTSENFLAFLMVRAPRAPSVCSVPPPPKTARLLLA